MFLHFSQLTESNITLRIRQVDIPLVESLIDNIQQQYKQKTKKDITLKIDTDNFLPADGCGGVELLASRGNYIIEISIVSIKIINRYLAEITRSIYNMSQKCDLIYNFDFSKILLLYCLTYSIVLYTK